MNDSAIPVGLQRVGEDVLEIAWSDGSRQHLRIRALRDACPCATCREKAEARRAAPRTSLPVLGPADARPAGIASMQPAGNYGYRIAFTDGHASGIFTFELLRNLGGASHGS